MRSWNGNPKTPASKQTKKKSTKNDAGKNDDGNNNDGIYNVAAPVTWTAPQQETPKSWSSMTDFEKTMRRARGNNPDKGSSSNAGTAAGATGRYADLNDLQNMPEGGTSDLWG